MQTDVRLDISMKKTSVCILIVHEATVFTDPHTLADAIEKTGLKIYIVGFESDSLSHYLMQEFREMTINAVCVDARKISAILSMKINKTDKNDGRGVANAMRAGMFSRVYEKPQEFIDRGTVLAMRRCLIQQGTDIKNHV